MRLYIDVPHPLAYCSPSEHIHRPLFPVNSSPSLVSSHHEHSRQFPGSLRRISKDIDVPRPPLTLCFYKFTISRSLYRYCLPSPSPALAVSFHPVKPLNFCGEKTIDLRQK